MPVYNTSTGRPIYAKASGQPALDCKCCNEGPPPPPDCLCFGGYVDLNFAGVTACPGRCSLSGPPLFNFPYQWTGSIDGVHRLPRNVQSLIACSYAIGIPTSYDVCDGLGGSLGPAPNPADIAVQIAYYLALPVSLLPGYSVIATAQFSAPCKDGYVFYGEYPTTCSTLTAPITITNLISCGNCVVQDPTCPFCYRFGSGGTVTITPECYKSCPQACAGDCYKCCRFVKFDFGAGRYVILQNSAAEGSPCAYALYDSAGVAFGSFTCASGTWTLVVDSTTLTTPAIAPDSCFSQDPADWTTSGLTIVSITCFCPSQYDCHTAVWDGEHVVPLLCPCRYTFGFSSGETVTMEIRGSIPFEEPHCLWGKNPRGSASAGINDASLFPLSGAPTDVYPCPWQIRVILAGGADEVRFNGSGANGCAPTDPSAWSLVSTSGPVFSITSVSTAGC